MSSSASGDPSPWVRNSTAQGRRRRESLRLRIARGDFGDRPSTLDQSQEQRPTKRTASPLGSAAKRMRRCEEEEEESSSMGEERVHDESIEDGREEEEGDARTMQHQGMGHSCSSSDSDGDDMVEEIEEEDEAREGMDDDYEDEEEMEDEEEIEVDKTDIITSDEGEFQDEDRENFVDGPVDSYERMQRFRKFSFELGQRFEMIPMKEPNQLTNRCRGLGPADEVWSVLCHKDELHSIGTDKFMEGHDPARPITTVVRATLIDWLQEVCAAEKLHRETFHLAIDYVDRFMAKGPQLGVRVKIHSYQLLGTTALFVAAKYEEIYPPKVEEIVQYTDRACSVEQVRELETILLKVLEWELNVVTPLHWSHLFLELLTGNAKPSSFSSRLTLLPSDDHWSESEGVEIPATTGSCMRDDFMHIALVMDVVVLHDGCRRFTNRAVAAAVLYSMYDAVEAIEQVTGLSPSCEPVKSAIDWVEPIVVYCEKNRDPLPKLPVIEGIKPDVVHMIQLHRTEASRTGGVDVVISDIIRLRHELLLARESCLSRVASSLPAPPSTPHSRSAPIRLRNTTRTRTNTTA